MMAPGYNSLGVPTDALITNIGGATKMKNSTARKLEQLPTDYLIVGIDAHKKKHAAVSVTTSPPLTQWQRRLQY